MGIDREQKEPKKPIQAVKKEIKLSDKQSLNIKLSGSSERRTKKTASHKSNRLLGKLEKLGKSFKIESIKSTFTYDYFICDNCGNEKAHWNYNKTSLGPIHLCSRCKTLLAKRIVRDKVEKGKDDAIFKVVNRRKKY